MQLNKYSELLEKLENEELEKINLDGPVYSQLMAIYLYQNKLANAKLLWMRIPDNLKDENAELMQLNQLSIALQNNNCADFFKHIKYEWSENIRSIINDALMEQREQVLTLAGNAYASIYDQNLLEMTQMSPQELKDACAALNWTHEQEGDKLIWLPKPKEPAPSKTNEEHLLKLTEFVSFLEN